MNERTLVFGHRPGGSSRALITAAGDRGLAVVELTGAVVPPELRGSGAHLYSGLRHADRLAAELGVLLLEAPAGWLPALPAELVGRDIAMTTLGEAYDIRTPVFVKAPNTKDVPARVYADGSRLPGPDALDRGTPVLVSDPVRFAAEFRLYVLDGEVRTGSQYALWSREALEPLEGHGRRGEVLGFAREMLAVAGGTLPGAVVVDVGVIAEPDGGERWAVVEANGAWGSGCYAADPGRALEVVLRSSGPGTLMGERDRSFARVKPLAY
ncbi:hypothetical protein GCM10023085_44250 [Actinomadura viridis]|uniref:ATP-grasp domain-containing protein n=1 Tax=Actinomadura viridis TaxID=58110 RepID=A0A931DKK3_9ACTN|nr:ATP-grasp domain-containing protein [Actinomadura viridis]MBG6089787.1 hypothetical protein [Actinomadura viridis]